MARNFLLSRLFSKKLSRPEIPQYLSSTYWWAYIHPNAVWVFERQWLVNSILWGNFCALRDAAIEELSFPSCSLQVACVYGDFSEKLAKSMTKDSELHIIDVAEIQLENVKKKVKGLSNVFIHHQDSVALDFDDDNFDNVVLFFLLHEQPEMVRLRTVQEALRVLKPGGKCVFVDYHQPAANNPFRYLMRPVLKYLEPFALDMWTKEIESMLPEVTKLTKQTYFGGLYQKVVVTK